MSAPTPLKPQVIRPSWWKSALLLLATAAFTAIGVAMLVVGDPEDFWPGMFVTVFFGLGVVVALMNVVRPATLTLDHHGFTHRGLLGRRFSVAWDDVEHLRIWSNPSAPRQRMVAWTLKSGRSNTGLLARLNRQLGIDGALPGGWAMSPSNLLALMELWRSGSA